jgi:hypothetical protein
MKTVITNLTMNQRLKGTSKHETKSSSRKMKDGQTYLFADGNSGPKRENKFLLSAAGKLSSAALTERSGTILVLSVGLYNKKCHSVGEDTAYANNEKKTVMC